MAHLGIETKDKRCKKCRWCAKYDNYDVLQSTHTPVYYCTVGDFYSKTKPEMTPNVGGDCLCFSKPYKDNDED